MDNDRIANLEARMIELEKLDGRLRLLDTKIDRVHEMLKAHRDIVAEMVAVVQSWNGERPPDAGMLQ